MTNVFQIPDITFGAGEILALASFVYFVWLIFSHRDVGFVTDLEIWMRRRASTAVRNQDVMARPRSS